MSNHKHPKGHPHHHNNAGGSDSHSHKKSRINLRHVGGIVVIGLMLLGMVIYVLSDNESIQFSPNPDGNGEVLTDTNPPMPAAE